MIIKDSVVMADNNYVLTSDGAKHLNGRSVLCYLTTSNASQVDGVQLPAVFAAGWYSWNGSEFALTAAGLEQYKRYLKNRINEYAAVVEYGAIMLGGTKVATTETAQNRVSGMWAAVQQDPSRIIDFKNDDGTWSQINAAQVEAIAAAVADHVQACYSYEKLMNDAVDACSNLAELEAVDIYTGWPENAPAEEV